MTARKSYVVTAPYITLRVGTPEGRTLVGYYAGAVLPDDADEDGIAHHLDRDMIAPVAQAEKILQGEPDELPTNTGSIPESGVYDLDAAKSAPAKSTARK